MKKRVLKVLLMSFICGLILTGCGSSFPEMTEEEYDQVVQYSVALLMKYSNNGVEKLSSLSALELEKQMRRDEREARKAARDAETAQAVADYAESVEQGTGEEAEAAPIDDKKDESELEIAESEPVDVAENPQTPPEEETPDSSDEGKTGDDIDELLEKYGDELDQGIESTGVETETEEPQQPDETQTTPETTDVAQTDSTDSAPVATEADVAIDGMRQELSKGIFLTYSGYSVAGSYPDNDDIFVINAAAGKKLLILNFRLANVSGMDVSVDMEKANPHFQVLLNGVNVGYTNVTMLENDLSSYKGTIPAGAKLSMVLIKQMDAEKVKNVSTLGLIGDMGTETIQFNLE